ncbi:hypothetical protein P3T76_001483 [Phytophthora citrophthora]|uniref:Uncharacterized protein n=1 Tax=Phytophthora citrophthora TaxID=4793 RepID=A0AAD9H053_9STRA|nr:hypothetical protein P3T76_001483 [Phytophthora citrophthora]
MKAIAEKKILARLSSMENDNFVRLFKANFTPQRAKSTGRIKTPEQFANYKEFYALAKITGLE